ncbi:hypothetical protein ABTO23_18710, partial [Acinetobacter baumannii]
NWRKNYPFYFHELVKVGIESVDHPARIAQQGLETAKSLFNFNRAEQSHTLTSAIANIKDQPFESFILKGTGSSTIEPWFIPYHGKK